MLSIYLDCCVINRPLDDQRHPQVAAEAAAVRQLLLFVRWKRICWLGAPILRVELEACADTERRMILLSILGELCTERPNPISRGDEMLSSLLALNLSLPDAAHIASASRIGATIFVTCDRQLLKLRGRIELLAGLRLMSPLQAVAELSL